MTLDTEHHRLFLSCEENNLMTVFDLDKNAPIVFLPMADGPDVIKFDAGLKRIYAACSSGAISVFPVQKRVHSLAVDAKTHRVYAPEQEENGKPVARRDKSGLLSIDALVEKEVIPEVSNELIWAEGAWDSVLAPLFVLTEVLLQPVRRV